MLTTALVLCVLAQAELGQVEAGGATTVAPPPAEPAVSSVPGAVRLAAGAQIEVELVDTLGSSTNKLGDRFKIRLVEPVSSQGQTVIAPGAMGEGEVIDVARAGMGGKQGKLIISARYLDLNGRRVRVRGMTFMTSGKSRVDLATGVLLIPYVGLTAGFIKGGEIEIPAGARATVRLAEDLDLPTNPILEATGKF